MTVIPSSYITVTNNLISPMVTGIYVNNPGDGNVVSYNHVTYDPSHDTPTDPPSDGISITTTPGTALPASMQVIQNMITGAGCDGILIESSNIVVKNNTVSGSGARRYGCSGIHVYHPGTIANGIGAYNTIIANVAIANLDSTAQDGNGIELDQQTTENTVSQNLALQNDGGGIILYDAPSNRVTYNVLFSNAEDRGGTHSYLAELILNDSNLNSPITASNTIEYNALVSYLPTAEAAFVATTKVGNTYSSNTLAAVSNMIYDIAGVFRNMLSVWDSLLGASDFFENPTLTDPTGGPYAYTFPSGTVFSLGGKTITLYGWNPTPGLYGTSN